MKLGGGRFDRCWRNEVGSEDCHGRCLWALGLGVEQSSQPNFQMLAGHLFELALPAANVAAPFLLSGLGQLAEAALGVDRLVQF